MLTECELDETRDEIFKAIAPTIADFAREIGKSEDELTVIINTSHGGWKTEARNTHVLISLKPAQGRLTDRDGENFAKRSETIRKNAEEILRPLIEANGAKESGGVGAAVSVAGVTLRHRLPTAIPNFGNRGVDRFRAKFIKTPRAGLFHLGLIPMPRKTAEKLVAFSKRLIENEPRLIHVVGIEKLALSGHERLAVENAMIDEGLSLAPIEKRRKDERDAGKNLFVARFVEKTGQLVTLTERRVSFEIQTKTSFAIADDDIRPNPFIMR